MREKLTNSLASSTRELIPTETKRGKERKRDKGREDGGVTERETMKR